ncbi:MAG: type I glyceraldehyde-3-phosphate dehydrogenase [Desulfarculaceae bacterium]|nr:type I glyceraldehyde-3-phosphate dehydrogenase [Desulfarculaceae bacterium]MCF8071598.1 type I glyceraldehyde-3-phosphate dehydrogenase [Desulfarculaceae bacterium]MCF8103205.1 type I glyceraldehyde-3-phosphate dehydrogenase [Desulfarculaceae bacterium]MCF8114877.1 type I glyceraldehyde-3-phosphate dehydrogenase [Desulfarculaceae bacterium]
MVRIGINGFGRIGRQVVKAILERHPEQLQVVAVNDLFDAETNAHLFKFDSNYGRWPGKVEAKKNAIIIDGQPLTSFAMRDPAQIPWDDVGVELVIEGTGLFRTGPQAEAHLEAGAKRVIITAPGKEVDLTVVMGVNHRAYRKNKHYIVSNASCTTNCLAPPAMVIHKKFGIIKGLMTTVHSYTNDQRILDLPHKDLRRARAAGLNMIPTSTGAARALGIVIPELAGRFDGCSVRVPTPTVSLVDFTAQLAKPTDTKGLRSALKQAAGRGLKGIMAVDQGHLVSMDLKGDPHSSIVDLEFTQVLDGDLVKVLAWYDNEWGYSCRVTDLAAFMVSKGL